MNQANINEFETKVLNINHDQIAQKLKDLGAKETPEFLTRRYVFNFESENIEFIRLRINGEKTTLTYKYKVIGNTAVGKTVEIETEVSDFEKMAQILLKIKFAEVFYQETRSHIFQLNGIEFSIDTWPKISSILEIESTSEEKVQEGLKLLNLEGKDVGDKDIVDIYMDEVGFSPNSVPELKFEQ